MDSCKADKFKVFIRYEQALIAVLLPTDINFGNLVKYVWKKLNLNDATAIILSYNIGETKTTLHNDDDVEVFKTLALETPFHVHTLLVDHSPHTPVVNLLQKNQLLLTNLNCMPLPPHSPTVDYNIKKGGVKVNDLFDDKETCIYEISVKCLKEGYQFCVVRSNPTRYNVKCSQPECKWHIYSRRVGDTSLFKVTSVNDNHLCSKIVFNPNHRNAYAKTLARIISPKLADPTRVYRPKDIVHDLNLDMNIDVSYKRAWRGRHLALESNQGCPRASFEQLPLYCHNLKVANRDTVTHIETDDASRFKNLFIGFGVAVSMLLPFLSCLVSWKSNLFIRVCIKLLTFNIMPYITIAV